MDGARPEKTAVILQHSRHTREAIRASVSVMLGEPQKATVLERTIFHVLKEKLAPQFTQAWDPDDEYLADIVDAVRRGNSLAVVAEKNGIPRKTVEDTVRDWFKAQIIEWYLTSKDGNELVRIAERLGVETMDAYEVIPQFVAFASATLAREDLESHCEQTHGGLRSGGGGRDARASGCQTCVLRNSFDRYGELKVSNASIAASRLSELRAVGVYVVELDPHLVRARSVA